MEHEDYFFVLHSYFIIFPANKNLQERFMETPQPKSAQNRKVIVGVVIVILLCCCLMAVAVAGYYGWQAYQATQAAIDEIENLDIPSEIPTDFPSIPGFTGAELPQGGLSDDVTRATAWGSLFLTASIFDCPTP